MEMDFSRRQAVNFSFSHCNSLKYGDRLFLHPRRQFAARNELLDLGKIPLFVVTVFLMPVSVVMFRFMMVGMIAWVVVPMIVGMSVVMIMCEMDIELHASDGGFLPARNVQMIAVEFELLQLAFKLADVRAEVEQRGDEHVAGDAAEDIEIKDFHFIETSVLIWLAA